MGATTGNSPVSGEMGGEETRVESTGPNPTKESRISRDDLFDVLSNHRRRYALHFLEQRDEAVGIGDLAEEVAAWENDIPRTDLTATQRKRVYTSLQQFHLPKMDTTGIVEFDGQRGVVSLDGTTENLDVYLDVVTEDDIPWSRFYLGLSALSLAAVVGVWVIPFAPVSAVAMAGLVAAVFLLSSLAHTYSNRRMRLGSDGPPPDRPEE